ncbi:MAG: prolyl oligopeptidase family serine peptidase [Mycobacteriales bacterium]
MNRPATTKPTALDWAARFRATRVSLPDWARDAPERCLYVSNATGTFEVYAWDRTTGSVRQVTDRPDGTSVAAIDPTGHDIWWFDDAAGDEFGSWQRQPFDGGPDQAAAPGLAPAYSAGLALGRQVAVVGCSTDDGTSVYAVRRGAEPRLLYTAEQDAHVGGLSYDETLVAIAHSEHGDSRHMAVRVLRVADGSTVGELWDGPGKGLEVVGFAPVGTESRLLVVHERTDQPRPLLWNPVPDTETALEINLDGDLEADWYADGTALLVRQDGRGRSALHRYELADHTLTALGTPTGTVGAATARPDGAVEFSWSSSEIPPEVRDDRGRSVLAPAGPRPPAAYPVEDLDIDGLGGRVHALLTRPLAQLAPYATVFELHGGPTWADSDSYDADRAAWVDAGYAVVHVNYRGSTGYGAAWRDALEGRPGLTELEDVSAVRGHLVAAGVVDPDRLVLAGGSWGGYLTLLGLGTQPEVWAAGVAAVPVADYVAAYEDEMEQLRAFDRALFGGSPEQVPEVYARCSPLTYVEAVRAPVLVLAGANDPRCPIRQIDNYLIRLTGLGKPHEVYRFDAGHGSLVVEERIAQMAAMLDFASRHVRP